jgi:outer membrane protein W
MDLLSKEGIMKILRMFAVAGVLAFWPAVGAQAQTQLDITPFTGGTFFLADPPDRFALGNESGPDMILERAEFSPSFTLGLNAGFKFGERWAVEGLFSWLSTNLSATEGLWGAEADVNAFMYGLTGLYYLPLTPRYQPFFGVGVGAETFNYQIAGIESHTDWMGNVVGGLYVQLSDRFGLRLEARDCFARFEAWENDLMTTVGFSFRTPWR